MVPSARLRWYMTHFKRGVQLVYKSSHIVPARMIVPIDYQVFKVGDGLRHQQTDHSTKLWVGALGACAYGVCGFDGTREVGTDGTWIGRRFANRRRLQLLNLGLHLIDLFHQTELLRRIDSDGFLLLQGIQLLPPQVERLAQGINLPLPANEFSRAPRYSAF